MGSKWSMRRISFSHSGEREGRGGREGREGGRGGERGREGGREGAMSISASVRTHEYGNGLRIQWNLFNSNTQGTKIKVLANNAPA